MVQIELKNHLISLANQYETADFCKEDPSQFLRWYKLPDAELAGDLFCIADVECASFIAAMLSFGSRKQFIPKIHQILQTADTTSRSVSSWLKSRAYKTTFPHGTQKFYRFYSFDDMQTFFDELASILLSAPTLGEYFKSIKEGKAFPSLQSHCQPSPANVLSATPSNGVQPPRNAPLASIISMSFPKSKIVPKGKTSANKRIHMFLRWMVRTNSPVDLGLWTWYSPADLIIPLDVHVLKESQKMGLIPQNAPASLKTAELLTAQMAQIFPSDPSRADFALFGLGVDAE